MIRSGKQPAKKCALEEKPLKFTLSAAVPELKPHQDIAVNKGASKGRKPKPSVEFSWSKAALDNSLRPIAAHRSTLKQSHQCSLMRWKRSRSWKTSADLSRYLNGRSRGVLQKGIVTLGQEEPSKTVMAAHTGNSQVGEELRDSSRQQVLRRSIPYSQPAIGTYAR